MGEVGATMTQPVTLYLRRKTIKSSTSGLNRYAPDYYLRSSPKKPWKRLQVQAGDLWEGLGLPQEDGEYEVEGRLKDG